ncbi:MULTISPECIES: C40 family peptidase [unclassified Modestobacter]|uniref:C40 family peptidase n=1 Tax=unclassified Modestobacter TaxID=2643866 RepID=UPI0022AB1AEA|nr:MULTISPECIES: NlpC/P60 family protein [unclassified Modestobacter]MCZ2827134.1 NlpC/P60 family protein [Modestobacter sp. VKM Ac-2981]MCZ2854385.1 NlpC/P60 family protein [Modestobacter sp. VKM Ac-2982]
MGTKASTQRRTGTRPVRRMAGVVVAATLCLVAAPGVAAATPTNPSDDQISAARQQQDAAAQQVGSLSAELATAQAEVDAARAQSAIALDTFQAQQAEYEVAQAAADAAAASADQAAAELTTARADIATFARQSYQQGSTSPTLEALTTADGPAQMLERAALLEAAGAHQGDVVTAVTAAEEQARAAESAAQASLTAAATLKQEAEDALATAEELETGARAQAAGLAARQASLEQELAQAQQALLGLQGARAAAEQHAAQQAAAERAAAERAAAERASAERAATERASAPTRSIVSEPRAGTSAGTGDSSAVETAISAARRHLGTIYSWGGGSLTGPSMGWGVDAGIVGFDCSGLTRYAYAQAGVSIPRNSRAQYSALPTVSRSDLQRGDLVFWATDTSRPSTIHHVAIYLGGGQILEAPQSGSVIRVTSMRWSGFIGGVRPTG